MTSPALTAGNARSLGGRWLWLHALLLAAYSCTGKLMTNSLETNLTTHYSLPEVLAMIVEASQAAGSMTKYAREVGCSKQFVSSVLRGERSPSDKILKHHGLQDAGRRWIKVSLTSEGP